MKIIYIYINKTNPIQLQGALQNINILSETIVIIYFSSKTPYCSTNKIITELLILITQSSKRSEIHKKTFTNVFSSNIENMHPWVFLDFLEAEFKIQDDDYLPIKVRIKEFSDDAQIIHFAPFSALYFLPESALNVNKNLHFLAFEKKIEFEIRNRISLLKKIDETGTNRLMFYSYHIEDKPEIIRDLLNKMMELANNLSQNKQPKIVDIIIYTKKQNSLEKSQLQNLKHLSLQNAVLTVQQVFIEETFEEAFSKRSLGQLMPNCFPLFAENLLKKRTEYNFNNRGNYNSQTVECKSKFCLEISGNIKLGLLKDHLDHLMTDFENQIN